MIDEVTGDALDLDDQWHPNTFFADNDNVVWVKGQLEIGASGFKHWQFVFGLKKKTTLTGALKLFPKMIKPHLEATRSDAADEYVHKDESAVPDTRFELGVSSDMFLINRLKA